MLLKNSNLQYWTEDLPSAAVESSALTFRFGNVSFPTVNDWDLPVCDRQFRSAAEGLAHPS